MCFEMYQNTTNLETLFKLNQEIDNDSLNLDIAELEAIKNES